MSWNGYRMSRDMWGHLRHEHIHVGWTTTFDMDGKRWKMKLGSQYTTKMEVKCNILSKHPAATNIRCEKIICEV